jgi:hypothetical protein
MSEQETLHALLGASPEWIAAGHQFASTFQLSWSD